MTIWFTIGVKCRGSRLGSGKRRARARLAGRIDASTWLESASGAEAANAGRARATAKEASCRPQQCVGTGAAYGQYGSDRGKNTRQSCKIGVLPAATVRRHGQGLRQAWEQPAGLPRRLACRCSALTWWGNAAGATAAGWDRAVGPDLDAFRLPDHGCPVRRPGRLPLAGQDAGRLTRWRRPLSGGWTRREHRTESIQAVVFFLYRSGSDHAPGFGQKQSNFV